MFRVQGKFSIPYSEPKVQPLFHVSLIPLQKSLYLPSADPFFLLQRLELDNHTQRQIPSKQSPKKKETNRTCLPAHPIPQSPTTPLPCRNSPRLCLCLSPYIYLSIHPIHHLFSNHSILIIIKQINNNSLPTTTHASSNLIMLFYQVGTY